MSPLRARTRRGVDARARRRSKRPKPPGRSLRQRTLRRVLREVGKSHPPPRRQRRRARCQGRRRLHPLRFRPPSWPWRHLSRSRPSRSCPSDPARLRPDPTRPPDPFDLPPSPPAPPTAPTVDVPAAPPVPCGEPPPPRRRIAPPHRVRHRRHPRRLPCRRHHRLRRCRARGSVQVARRWGRSPLRRPPPCTAACSEA